MLGVSCLSIQDDNAKGLIDRHLLKNDLHVKLSRVVVKVLVQFSQRYHQLASFEVNLQNSH